MRSVDPRSIILNPQVVPSQDAPAFGEITISTDDPNSESNFAIRTINGHLVVYMDESLQTSFALGDLVSGDDLLESGIIHVKASNSNWTSPTTIFSYLAATYSISLFLTLGIIYVSTKAARGQVSFEQPVFEAVIPPVEPAPSREIFALPGTSSYGVLMPPKMINSLVHVMNERLIDIKQILDASLSDLSDILAGKKKQQRIRQPVTAIVQGINTENFIGLAYKAEYEEISAALLDIASMNNDFTTLREKKLRLYDQFKPSHHTDELRELIKSMFEKETVYGVADKYLLGKYTQLETEHLRECGNNMVNLCVRKGKAMLQFDTEECLAILARIEAFDSQELFEEESDESEIEFAEEEQLDFKWLREVDDPNDPKQVFIAWRQFVTSLETYTTDGVSNIGANRKALIDHEISATVQEIALCASLAGHLKDLHQVMTSLSAPIESFQWMAKYELNLSTRLEGAKLRWSKCQSHRAALVPTALDSKAALAAAMDQRMFSIFLR